MPHPTDTAPHPATLADLKDLLPVFLSYVLSFIYVGIYWNNHHHMFHSTKHVTGGILWANLHLLFWLSLFPFITGWMGENHLAPTPTAVYGFVLLMAAIAYFILQRTIIAQQGRGSLLAAAIGKDWKTRWRCSSCGIAVRRACSSRNKNPAACCAGAGFCDSALSRFEDRKISIRGAGGIFPGTRGQGDRRFPAHQTIRRVSGEGGV